MSYNTILAGDDIINKGGIHFVDGGQSIEIPPAFVIIGIIAELIPAEIGRILALVCADAVECSVFVEIEGI